MSIVRARIAPGGRVAIPVDFRRALGLHDGDAVILRLDVGEVRIFSTREAIKRAQELVARYVPSDRSLADELIAERRRESCE